MKSSFMLYILCMKISDPESRCYCTRASVEGGDPLPALSGRELTFFMDTDSTGTPETAMYPEYAAYIVLSSRRGSSVMENSGMGGREAKVKRASHARPSTHSMRERDVERRRERGEKEWGWKKRCASRDADEDVCLSRRPARFSGARDTRGSHCDSRIRESEHARGIVEWNAGAFIIGRKNVARLPRG